MFGRWKRKNGETAAIVFKHLLRFSFEWWYEFELYQWCACWQSDAIINQCVHFKGASLKISNTIERLYNFTSIC